MSCVILARLLYFTLFVFNFFCCNVRVFIFMYLFYLLFFVGELHLQTKQTNYTKAEEKNPQKYLLSCTQLK